MSHPHPYGEAVAALYLSTIPVLGVVGLIVGERLEAARRSGGRTRPETAPASLSRLDPVGGTD